MSRVTQSDLASQKSWLSKVSLLKHGYYGLWENGAGRVDPKE